MRPVPAWTMMLRATSEMAVAINVASVREKPSRSASARACARAGTMSVSLAMSTVTSSFMLAGSPVPVIQQSDRPFQVEGGAKGGEVKVELHHGDGDIGLDADDDGGGASQPCGDGDGPQRAGDEGVDDVEGGDIHD